MTSKPDPGAHEAAAALREATRGLLYPSETDEPFDVVTWPGNGQPVEAKTLLARAGEKPGTPVTVATLDDFFGDLITDQDWFGEEEKACARRYRQLLEVIKTRLDGIKVFHVGEVDVAIYIIGQTQDGDWAGLRTRAVET